MMDAIADYILSFCDMSSQLDHMLFHVSFYAAFDCVISRFETLLVKPLMRS